MNRTLARLLTRLYPQSWRERYGAEFAALLEAGQGGLWTVANVAGAALRERIFPTRGRTMVQDSLSFRSMTRRPSAFVPVLMSLTALALVLGDVAIYGVVHEARAADEGAVAHLWQLLMAGQLPFVLWFAIRWLPRAPRQTLGVLALQAGAGLASMAPVFLLGL